MRNATLISTGKEADTAKTINKWQVSDLGLAVWLQSPHSPALPSQWGGVTQESRCRHFWDIVTGASSCATHLPLKSFLKLKIKTKWFKLELPANEIDMIFTWVGSCQKDEGMFWWWYRVPEITYRMAPLHTKRNSSKVIQKKGNKGKNQTWIPHSQPGASSMASPCLSGGVKLRRELDSDSQRHSISHHSVNLTFQDMMEWETCQTDARVVSWVYCKTPLHQNALQRVWSSSSGHVVELHRAAGCGQMGHISLLSQRNDLSVWDILLCSSPAVRTGDVPEGGTRVSEVDNLEQSPLKTSNLHEGWELNLCPGEPLKSQGCVLLQQDSAHLFSFQCKIFYIFKL